MNAGIKMMKGLKKNAFNITITCITIACMVLFSLFSIKFSTIFYILIFGAVGVVAYLLKGIKKEDKA